MKVHEVFKKVREEGIEIDKILIYDHLGDFVYDTDDYDSYDDPGLDILFDLFYLLDKNVKNYTTDEKLLKINLSIW